MLQHILTAVTVKFKVYKIFAEFHHTFANLSVTFTKPLSTDHLTTDGAAVLLVNEDQAKKYKAHNCAHPLMCQGMASPCYSSRGMNFSRRTPVSGRGMPDPAHF